MTQQQPQNDRQRALGRGMVYLAWLVFIALVTWLFSNILERQHNPNRQLAISQGNAEVVLQRNRWGHYVASGHINDTEVTFMLDTGATDISVPAGLADRLGLERGVERIYQTANGPAKVWATRLQRVALGPLQLTNLRAHINPNVQGDEVLLGMTYLKHLEMVQKGDTLTLRYGTR